MAQSGTLRGGLQVGNTLYTAWSGEVYTVDQSGNTTLLSTLSGTDNIFLARNNATTPDIALVCDAGPFVIDTSTTPAVKGYGSIDGDVGSPTCVREHLGYFMFGYGDGTIQASDLNSTNLNTLNQARTESNPDGVVNIVSYNGQMYVMGEKTVEIWGDPTNATGFPLTRVGYHIVPGLLAPHAVSGWEPEFGYPFIWVGSDATVRQLDGYSARKISTPDLDRLIADVAFPDTELDALCYVTGGHAFWQINGPSWSWVYHVNTGTWHERRSIGETKSDLTRSVPAFDKWLVGTKDSPDILEMDYSNRREAANLLPAIMESGPAKDFPNRQRITRVDFDFTPGVGIANGTDPIQTDPSVLIEESLDGGRTWPYSWVRELGRQADSNHRVFIVNAGLSNDEGARYRWTVSDPVHVGFTGADMKPEVRKN
jgi:hypothetical protein